MAKQRKGSFPAETASDSEKNSMDYGLEVGKAIQDEWFSTNGGGGTYYYDYREEFHRLRRYARGEQSIKKYQDELRTNNDLSYTNLDWKPVPIIPKFKDIIVNGMHNRLFDVQVKSVDPIASKMRGKARKALEREMVVKQYMDQIKETTGETGLFSQPGEIPDNPEELELHMQLNYKQGIEVAEELAIEHVLKKNEYEFTRKRVIDDLVTIGIGCVKNRFTPSDGILVEYVNPADVVYSKTDDPYFRDCYYWGEVKEMDITQLKKEFPHLTKEEIEDLAPSQKSRETYSFGSYGSNQQKDKGDTVSVLYFTYKTFNTDVYKKKYKPNGGEVISKRDDTFNPPKDKRSQFEKISTVREVLYEGAMILKQEKLLKWELQKNMIRKKDDLTKVCPPYVMHAPSRYNGRIESLVQRMTSYADLIQLTHLKLQQAVQKQTPDGVALNMDALMDIDLGDGTMYNAREALNMYFQTGSVVYRSMTADGDPNGGALPVLPTQGNNSGQKIQVLIGVYNQYLNNIRDVTGLNEASDGSTPSEYALPGVQKLAAANSNTATRHILDGMNFITKKTAEGISERISDVLEYSPAKNELANAIGKFNTASLKDIKKLHLHAFGIFIQVHPDEEEREKLNANISIALGNGEISAADVIDVQQINNIKLASQLLKLRRKQMVQEKQQQEQANIQAQAQANAQAAQQAAEAEAQKEAVIAQHKIQIEQAKHQFAMEMTQTDVQAKLTLMDKEFQYKMQIQQMQSEAAANAMAQGEQKKDDRMREQASQNSQLIEQRNTRGPAKDFSALSQAVADKSSVESGGVTPTKANFESANDSLGDVGDLSSFEPQ